MLELGVDGHPAWSGWLYIGSMALLALAALRLPKRWWQKLVSVIVILLVFTGPAYLRNRERNQMVDERKGQYETATAFFDERCKAAGEKVNRTLQSVNGVVGMKWRPASPSHEQFALDDPYGKDCSMEGCIVRLLRGSDEHRRQGAKQRASKRI